MSWMDSWSRPSKSQATPPPLYLTIGDAVPYCHSCGRVIGERRKHAGQEVKYCSTRCRNNKPRPIDRRIEAVFNALLDGATPESVNEKQSDVQGDGHSTGRSGHGVHEKVRSGKRNKPIKGDSRIIVECATVEEIIFLREKDPTKVFGRRKNRAARGVMGKEGEWRSVDMVNEPPIRVTSPAAPSTASEKSHTSDSDSEHGAGGVAYNGEDREKPAYGFGGGKIRPPQAESEINGSIGGEKGWAERIHETDEMRAKRRDGERRAEEKEMVRRAARRGVAFGFGEEQRKCEAVMKGVVVESSFAKGEWGIRWREKV